MLGQTISHYRITDKLGAGGMGVVYKALDLQLERTVALKFLPHEVIVSDQDKQSLLREARAASALDHPNIGVIYGLEESVDHQFFIVMGYYEGETLAKKLGRGLLPVREALDLAIQIASGLSAAHAQKIVHRDIKPSNIILTKDKVAKIVDFGLARVLATSSATQSLNTSGTLPYMAPEQILGESVDQRCDVWALGVMLVQMLTASHPFVRENTAAMTFAILNQPPAGLDAMPDLLQPVAYRALSKEPAPRYASGKEMLADLEALRAQLTSSGGSSALEEQTVTRKISAGELKQYAQHASKPRWQTAPAEKSRRPIYIAAGVVLLAAASLLFPPIRERVAARLTSRGEKHIAVLPFDNIGNDPANEVLAAGLMDSLTGELSNLSAGQASLWVVPASIVRSHKVSDPAAAARDLGANLVVKGSIQRVGQDVHLTVDLIDANSLRQVGSAALEDRAGDIARLQDEAVARLAHLMKINVTAEMLRTTGGSVAPAAYESYLKALGYIQRYDKPGNLESAIAALENAVKMDPRFALGYAGLGQAYELRYVTDSNPKWIEEASAYCKQAAELDDHIPAVHVTLGRIHDSTGKYDLAVQEFQHALQLDARNTDALNGIANAYEKAGRTAEAEGALKRAIALRPDDWDGYNALGLFYDRQEKYDDAIAQLRRATELTPDNAQAYLNLGAVYLDTGDAKRFPEAEAALNRSIQINPTYAAYANIGHLLFLQARYAEDALATEKALQLNDKDYQVWKNLAEAYRWMKQSGKAAAANERELQLLEQTVRIKFQDPAVFSELATVYAAKQLRDKALRDIQKALALAPNDPDILVDAGEVYERLGDRLEAVLNVQKALSKGAVMDSVRRRSALQDLLSDPAFRAPAKQ
jgi:eukaryotic-like serine/threonine-protein kinase